MWKITNGQWIELSEEEKEKFLKEDSQYYREFFEVLVPNSHRVEVKARQDDQQQINGWKAEINLNGKAVYWAKVYIDRFPDLLVFLRDIEVLNKITR